VVVGGIPVNQVSMLGAPGVLDQEHVAASRPLQDHRKKSG
jgi:hypothetical protein